MAKAAVEKKKTPIFAELTSALKITRKKDEAAQQVLLRIVAAAQDMSDAAWGKLSEPSQEWVNNATRAMQNSKPLQVPSDMGDEPEAKAPAKGKAPAEAKATAKGKSKAKAEEEEDEDEDEGEGDEAEDEDEAPAKKSKSKEGKSPAKETKAPAKGKAQAEAKAPAKAKEKETKAPAKGKDGGAGIKVKIKMAILKKPDISLEDLLAKLEGVTASRLTVGNIRAEFRHSLRVLQDAQMLTKPLAL